MKCQNCGMENPDRANFCKECGTKLSHTTSNNNSYPPDFSASPYPKTDGIPSSETDYIQPFITSDFERQQTPTQKKQPAKWFTRCWVCIAALILFYPLGLYLLWKYRKDWSIDSKVLFSVWPVVLFFCLFVILFPYIKI